MFLVSFQLAAPLRTANATAIPSRNTRQTTIHTARRPRHAVRCSAGPTQDPTDEKPDRDTAPFRHSKESLARSTRLFFTTAVPDTSQTRLYNTTASLDRDIWRIAIPALATMAIDPLMGICDTCFVGRLGVAQLGAVGAASMIFKFAHSFFNFLSKTTTPLVARALVHSDTDTASRIVAQNLWVATAVGILVATVLFTCARPLTSLLVGSAGGPSSSATAQMMAHAVTYVRWRAIASPAVLITYVATGAFRGWKNTVTPLYVAGMSNMTNLVLDYTLIFIIPMGVAGASFATAISQIVTAVGLLSFMVLKGMLKLNHIFVLPDPVIVKEIAASSVFSIRTMSIMTAHALTGGIAARLGAVVSAAYAIGRQLWGIQAIALDSFEVAAQSMVAEALGRNDQTTARTISIRLLQMAMISGVVLGGLCCAFSPLLVSLFTSDPLVRKLAAQTVPMFSVLQPVSAMVFVFDGIFAAARDYAHTAKAVFFAGLSSVCWLGLTRPLWAVGAGAGAGAGAATTVWPGLAVVWGAMNVLTIARAVLLGSRFLSHTGPVPPFDRTARPAKDTLSDFLRVD